MVMRKIFCLFTFTVMVLAFSGFAQSSAAQDAAPSFKPVKAWEVGSFEQVTRFTGECLLQTEFDNGFILQFTGANSWVQSLNLNIRQNAFNAGQGYNTTLFAPGGISQQISGTATQASILSIPLKGQKALYQSIRDQAVLDITVEDNAFRFFLTGFATAAKEFERCMAGAQNVPAESANLQSGDAPVEYSNRMTAPDDFTFNESVLLEETEKQQDINIPEMAGASLPYDEGHSVTRHTNAVATPKPLSRPENSPHKRLSEQLAEDINANPDLIDVDSFDPVEQQRSDTREERLAEIVEQDDSTEAGLIIPPAFDAPPLITDVEPIARAPEAITIEPMENDIIVNDMPSEDALQAPTSTRVIQSEPILPEGQAQLLAETMENDQPPAPVTNVIEDVVETPPEPAPIAMPMPEVIPEPAPEPTRFVSPEPIITTERMAGEADFTQMASAETGLSAGASTSDLARIAVLERDLEMLRAENATLNEELSASLREGEQERLSISSENWNLEQATKRYNEAERQIKRLGQQVQKERAQCTMEKKELEAMLFDPQLTEQSQLARLSQLERELADAKATIASLRGGRTQ